MNRHTKRINVAALLSAAVALSALAVVPAAFAAKTPKKLTEWKCQDFLAIEEVHKPKVFYWATGKVVDPGWEDPAGVIERTEKMIPVVIEECKAEPQAVFVKKVKQHMMAE